MYFAVEAVLSIRAANKEDAERIVNALHDNYNQPTLPEGVVLLCEDEIKLVTDEDDPAF